MSEGKIVLGMNAVYSYEKNLIIRVQVAYCLACFSHFAWQCVVTKTIVLLQSMMMNICTYLNSTACLDFRIHLSTLQTTLQENFFL